MKLQNNILFIGVVFLPIFLFAQNDTLPITINLGSSGENEVTRAKPASFIVTYPQNDTLATSYAINGFLEALYTLEAANLDISVIGELHRNSLPSKKQDTRQVGVKIGYGFKLLNNPFIIRLFPEVSVKYTADRINDKKGLQNLFYTYVEYDFKSKKEWITILEPGEIFPSNKRETMAKKGAESAEGLELYKSLGKLTSDWIQIRHLNSFGVEHIDYENVWLFNATFGVEVYPFSGLLYEVFKKYNLLQLRYNISHRSQLNSNQTDLFIGTTHSYAANINFMLKKNGKTALTFGYEHFNGGNPLQGLAETEFGQLKIAMLANLNF